MTTVTLGLAVTDFEIAATGDQTIKLSDFKSNNILLYFYPRDNTPGCITEGRDFRDHIEQFKALNTVIFGISRDSVLTHENFKNKQEFPFDLLSDSDEQLCTQFDVIKTKNMYGKQVRSIERSTFLIDKEGILIHQWRKVKVKTHIQDILNILQEKL